MPIDIRSRIPASAAVPTTDAGTGQALANYLDFYLNRRSGFVPEVIVRAARDQETLGFDSSLFPQYATRPAVWPVVGWALAHTTRLRLVAAHRIGVQEPAIAARTLATLDRLSDGRIDIHVLQGRGDEDLQRDGVFISKEEGYARSHEYLDIFLRTLSSTEPFSYEGRHYRIDDTRSDVRPLQTPYPPISIPGTSDQGIELAVKYADVHTVPTATLDAAAQAIEKTRAAARRLGRARPLGFWGDANIVLAASDGEAWQLAHRIGQAVAAVKGEAAEANYVHGDAYGRNVGDEGPVWYAALNRLTGHGYTLVGSPATLAAHFLGLYRLGVGVITLGGIGQSYSAEGVLLDPAGEHALLRELIALLHDGALAIDRARDPRDAELPPGRGAPRRPAPFV